MNSQWSDNLRKRMEFHEEPSPEGLWDDIEHIINQQKESTVDASLKRKGVLLWSRRIVAVAAVIIFFFLIGYNRLVKEQGNYLLPIQKFSQECLESDLNIPIEKRHIDNALIANHNNQSKNGFPKEEYLHNNQYPIEEVNLQEENSKDKVCGKIIQTKPDSDNFKNNRSNDPIQEHSVIEPEKTYGFEAKSNVIISKSRVAKWDANLYASNMLSGFTNKYSGYGYLASGEPPVERNREEPCEGENLLGDILVNNKYQDVYTDIKHRQPLTIGASISYNLNDKWTLTSGLTYTMLSSELRSGSNSYYYSDEQVLHYVGIPLTHIAAYPLLNFWFSTL